LTVPGPAREVSSLLSRLRYDVAADERFVTIEDIQPEGGAEPTIRVTQGWYEEFRDREQD
jgi:hypothetical protein